MAAGLLGKNAFRHRGALVWTGLARKHGSHCRQPSGRLFPGKYQDLHQFQKLQYTKHSKTRLDINTKFSKINEDGKQPRETPL
jgi:hypothetical protein